MNIYRNEFYLRSSDFDSREHIHPSSVLDIFQEAASCHAHILGSDFKQMADKGLMWMVTRVRYTLLSDPEPHTDVEVTTWPLPQKTALFRREYGINSLSGERLIIGSSEWVTVNIDSRRLANPKGIYPDSLDYCTDTQYEGRLPRLTDFEADGDGYTVHAGYSDIDMNGHVNNTKYANYVMNAIGLAPDKKVTDFQMDYHREVMCGEPLTVLSRRDGDTVFAKGINSDGDIAFLCKMTVR